MAYGNEVVLGWGLNEYAHVGAVLGVKLPRSAYPDEWKEDVETGEIVSIQAELDGRLDAAHLAALAGAGFTMSMASRPSIGRYTRAQTPCGTRSFRPFVFELFYDVGEMDDTPETSTFGVALSGRYFPTFLDWKDEHGTLYPVRFDAEMNRLIQIARHHIEAEFPIFSTASIIVVGRHY